MDNRGLTALRISWAYQILASKTADYRGRTVLCIVYKVVELEYSVNYVWPLKRDLAPFYN